MNTQVFIDNLVGFQRSVYHSTVITNSQPEGGTNTYLMVFLFTYIIWIELMTPLRVFFFYVQGKGIPLSEYKYNKEGAIMKQLNRYQRTTAPVSNLRREMDRIFNELIPFSWRLDESETPSINTWTPTTDMYETDGEYMVEVELPGLTKKDIQINCQDNVLSIEGERKFQREEEHPGYLRSERSYGAFKRSIILPAAILEDKVKATFNEGILKIAVPKAEKSKRKAVPIE